MKQQLTAPWWLSMINQGNYTESHVFKWAVTAAGLSFFCVDWLQNQLDNCEA